MPIDILDVEQLISDLCDVEQKSIGTDQEAKDAGAWVSLAKDAPRSSPHTQNTRASSRRRKAFWNVWSPPKTAYAPILQTSLPAEERSTGSISSGRSGW